MKNAVVRGIGLEKSPKTQQDGDISVESRPGSGATFLIELPALSRYPEERPAPDIPSESGARPTRILVVDDEAPIRDSLSRLLSADGHGVETAADGTEAWRMIQSNRYDHILLDLKMPGLGGQELYSQIRELDQELAKRVVFVTADASSLDADQSTAGIRNPLVGKPFRIQDLRQAILKSHAAAARRG